MTKIDIEKPWLDETDGTIVLFRPHIPKGAISGVADVLNSRWIGQGPRVDEFEQKFNDLVGARDGIAVGSGTDALHLSYLLAGVEPGDEVISTVFTCTATNIPLLYSHAKPVFADVQRHTMNIDPTDIEHRITPRTKAISIVHYGGLPCDMEEIGAIAKKHGLAVIEDAAHAVGATYRGNPVGSISDFTMFSFQAIKHITTGDGGYLTIKNPVHVPLAKRLRWFGIDRQAKTRGIWDNDIVDVGYKYQMTDIGAALGLSAIEEWQETFNLRQTLFTEYLNQLQDVPGVKVVGRDFADRLHAAWLMTVIVEDPVSLQAKLRENKIESNQVHFRNDRYSIFGSRRHDLPNMDWLESRYLVLPIHTQMTISDVQRICDVVKSFR